MNQVVLKVAPALWQVHHGAQAFRNCAAVVMVFAEIMDAAARRCL